MPAFVNPGPAAKRNSAHDSAHDLIKTGLGARGQGALWKSPSVSLGYVTDCTDMCWLTCLTIYGLISCLSAFLSLFWWQIQEEPKKGE